jgi:hypothetical protein
MGFTIYPTTILPIYGLRIYPRLVAADLLPPGEQGEAAKEAARKTAARRPG